MTESAPPTHQPSAEDPIVDQVLVTPLIWDPNWTEKAACKDTNENFLTQDLQGYRIRPPFRTQLEDRLIGTYCLGCPVRYDCLTESLRLADDWGIQGGLTEEERLPHIEAFQASGRVPLELWRREHKFSTGTYAAVIRTAIDRSGDAAVSASQQSAQSEQPEPLVPVLSKDAGSDEPRKKTKLNTGQSLDVTPLSGPLSDKHARITQRLEQIASMRTNKSAQATERRLELLAEIAAIRAERTIVA